MADIPPYFDQAQERRGRGSTVIMDSGGMGRGEVIMVLMGGGGTVVMLLLC